MAKSGASRKTSVLDKRRLIKFSNYSMCITLPKWVIDKLEWKKGDLLTLTTDVKLGKITLFKESEGPLMPVSEVIAETEPALLKSGSTESTPKLRW